MQPTAFQIEQATAVVTDPARFADQPALLGMAFATLKEARGQTVDFNRLPRVQHHSAHRTARHTGPALAPVAKLDTTDPTITARIRARAAQLGIATRGAGGGSVA